METSHFALFGLPERFAIDAPALDRAYRDVQTQVHPDRFATQGAAEQRVALQWATRANEAYRVLRDPLKRAIHLCALRGHDPADERNTGMPQDFLMQQLEWREALDAARETNDVRSIEALKTELDAQRRRLADEVAGALDEADDAARAADLARRWMFVERFAEEAH